MTFPIFVVQDDDDSREAMCTLLADEGYRVAHASNGSDALEQMQRGLRPGLVFLDLYMPVMTGFDFLATMKRFPALAEIPVVAFTGSAVAPVDGAVAVLLKPPSLDEVLELAARYCDRAKG